MSSVSLAGLRALVTGSGTGIGRGIATEFARRGAAVALHYSHSAEGAREAIAELRAASTDANVEAFPADFTELDDVRRLARQATDFLGGIDVLVNNSGVTMNRPFEQTTPEQFDTIFGVNIRAMFFLTQAVVPAMIQRGKGCVINLTSVHAFEGMPQHAAYAASKGAIVAFTRQLAIELAPSGVRVNAIAPGAVVVENYYKALGTVDREAMGRCIPCGFAGDPADIAGVAAFLASEEARFIVGQTLIVDGGTTSWMPFNDSFRQPLGGQFGKGYVPGV